MIKETIIIPIYNIPVDIIGYESKKEVNKKSPEYELLNRIGCVYKTENIVLVYNLFHKLSIGEIVHEIKHVVNEVIIEIAAKLDADNDEYECYLLQYLVDEILKIIKRVEV